MPKGGRMYFLNNTRGILESAMNCKEYEDCNKCICVTGSDGAIPTCFEDIMGEAGTKDKAEMLVQMYLLGGIDGQQNSMSCECPNCHTYIGVDLAHHQFTKGEKVRESNEALAKFIAKFDKLKGSPFSEQQLYESHLIHLNQPSEEK